MLEPLVELGILLLLVLLQDLRSATEDGFEEEEGEQGGGGGGGVSRGGAGDRPTWKSGLSRWAVPSSARSPLVRFASSSCQEIPPPRETPDFSGFL